MTIGPAPGGGGAAPPPAGPEAVTGGEITLRRAPLAAALAAVLVAGFLALAAGNLGYRGMWWDEASQFWMSQGVGRDSAPFAPRRGLADTVRWNAWENLDPGGFSVLLHGWTAVSRSLVWLRLLPFAFFLLGSLALALLGWRLTRSPVFAVAAGAVPALVPAALYFGLEIRAYSMEMAGIMLGALLLAGAVERPSPRRAALLGLVCAAFLTSRYSFVLAAAALLVALLGGCAGRVTGRTLRAQMAAAALPIAVSGAAIAAIMLPRQLRPEMHAGALGLSSPAYTHGGVLAFAPDVPALLARNLISPAALPITFAIVLVLVASARRLAARPGGDRPRPDAAGAAARFALLTFAAGVQTLSAAVSLLGLYPWDLAVRWSAYLVAVSAVAAVALAAEARARLLARAAPPRRRARRLGAGLATLIVAAAALGAGLHRQSVEGRAVTDVAVQLDLLPRAAFAPGRVFVTYYEAPALRYLYEYGPWAGRLEYPASFRFETPAEFEARAPIQVAREGISFVITALPPGEARARFPGCALQPYGPPGSRLLAVRPASGPGASRALSPAGSADPPGPCPPSPPPVRRRGAAVRGRRLHLLPRAARGRDVALEAQVGDEVAVVLPVVGELHEERPEAGAVVAEELDLLAHRRLGHGEGGLAVLVRGLEGGLEAGLRGRALLDALRRALLAEDHRAQHDVGVGEVADDLTEAAHLGGGLERVVGLGHLGRAVDDIALDGVEARLHRCDRVGAGHGHHLLGAERSGHGKRNEQQRRFLHGFLLWQRQRCDDAPPFPARRLSR